MRALIGPEQIVPNFHTFTRILGIISTMSTEHNNFFSTSNEYQLSCNEPALHYLLRCILWDLFSDCYLWYIYEKGHCAGGVTMASTSKDEMKSGKK
jgi:hypothetical protein